MTSPVIAKRTRTVPETHRAPTDPANGGLVAALLAAGLTCTVFGVLVAVAEAFKGWGASHLAISAGVGPLSGEAIWAIGAYVMLWPLLHVLLRNRTVKLRRWLLVSIALTGIGVALTFPPIYQSLA